MNKRKHDAVVDQASEHSFPASDAPAFAMGDRARQLEDEKSGRSAKPSPSRDVADRSAGPLSGKIVAILATDGFEQSELLEPKHALEEAGARTEVISPKTGHIRGWQKGEWGESVAVDVELHAAEPQRYDGLVLPGGVMNPDHLRSNATAVEFVRAISNRDKPIGAICHGPWMLVEAGLAEDATLTSWPSLQTDIRNAGGEWVDEEVVIDGSLVTSRKPDDLPAFNRKLLEIIATGGSGTAVRTKIKIAPADVS